MNTRLKDVADLAGVSIKTVSNVVHGYAHVTSTTRQRVQAALEALNYQPNLPARFLRKARVGVLALAIPDLSVPYFSELGDLIIREAMNRNYTVLLDHTGGERANELLVVQGLRPHLIDGVILSPLALQHEDLLARQGDMPLVLLGERFYDVPYDHVVIDNVAAARLATQHLITLGRRRIAAIGAQEDISGETARLRLRGYKEALLEAGYPIDPALIVPARSFHRSDGREAMLHLLTLEQPPDAVFCFNDLLALGALRALFERGLRVPEEVAVVGFDDIEDGRFATPSLTTIAPDKQQIAQMAVSFLLGRSSGTRTGPAEHTEASFRLVTRESTLGRS